MLNLFKFSKYVSSFSVIVFAFFPIIKMAAKRYFYLPDVSVSVRQQETTSLPTDQFASSFDFVCSISLGHFPFK